MAPPLRLYSATPHIGHGLDHASLVEALSWRPDVVVAQGTSTDPGPFYLGTGTSYMQRLEVKRDLRSLITNCKRDAIPFIVSLGGAGDDQSLARDLQSIDEISREETLSLRLAIISGEVDREWLLEQLRRGAAANRLVDSPFLEEALTPASVEGAVRVVAQMGPEPLVEALKSGNIDGIVTGRALDVGLFAAYPLAAGFSREDTMHFATIMHDGALACIPGSGSDGLFGTLNGGRATITTPNPNRRCTPVSVAAMSFYERPNPHVEAMPGGWLDVSDATYTPVDDRTVEITGSRWNETPYSIKLEGAALQGYRSICIGGACDPLFIAAVDDIIEASRARVTELVAADTPLDTWELAFRVYGHNVMLNRSAASAQPAEVGILIDVMADDPEVAAGVCSIARSALMHQGYDGRKTTAGNLAVPFSPVEVTVGPSYRYSIWHALELADPLEPFPVEITQFPREG